MKKYLLTVMTGNFDEGMCNDIGMSITPIVDSKFLNFVHNGGGTILFSFDSEVEKQDIYTYINGVLFGISDMFVLTEVNDSVTIYVDKNQSSNVFLNLQTGDSYDMKINMDDVMYDRTYKEDFEDDEEYGIFIEELKDKLKKQKIVRPSLDWLLDKIKDEGIGSLSSTEKNYLEQYSKNEI